MGKNQKRILEELRVGTKTLGRPITIQCKCASDKLKSNDPEDCFGMALQ